MNIRQSFHMAIKSIKGSRMRAFLTMLGIIIGVASVIVLVSLMNGMTSSITSEFESMGTNTLTVNITGRGSNRSYSEEEMEQFISENDSLFSGFSPTVNGMVTAKANSDSVSTTITGVNEMYQEIKDVTLTKGRFVTYVDCQRRENVCVIGTYLVNELFNGEDPVGQIIRLNGTNFTVIGVLEETADGEESSADDMIYLPYSTAMKMMFMGTVGSYTVAAADRDLAEQAKTALENELYMAFGDEDSYRVTSMSEMIETVNEMTGMMTAVLVGIAGISLLVGGIGIMNIMLVSVTERTREIGIRKALGARRRVIMAQFVIEAATTSSLGGVIGIAAGIVGAYAAGAVMDMAVSPTASSIALAFSVSVGIGMIFGYFPASKASKLNPIDALRYE